MATAKAPMRAHLPGQQFTISCNKDDKTLQLRTHISTRRQRHQAHVLATQWHLVTQSDRHLVRET
jgi:hypothetical protein